MNLLKTVTGVVRCSVSASRCGRYVAIMTLKTNEVARVSVFDVTNGLSNASRVLVMHPSMQCVRQLHITFSPSGTLLLATPYELREVCMHTKTYLQSRKDLLMSTLKWVVTTETTCLCGSTGVLLEGFRMLSSHRIPYNCCAAFVDQKIVVPRFSNCVSLYDISCRRFEKPELDVSDVTCIVTDFQNTVVVFAKDEIVFWNPHDGEEAFESKPLLHNAVTSAAWTKYGIFYANAHGTDVTFHVHIYWKTSFRCRWVSILL